MNARCGRGAESGQHFLAPTGAAGLLRRTDPASASPKRRCPRRQAWPQVARAGARGHDPGDRARPSLAARGPLGGTGGARIRGKKLASFRDALIAAPPEAMQSPEALAEALSAAGQAEERDANSCAGGQNAELVVPARRRRASDAEHVLRQTLALHRRAGALNRELKLAERSLAAEPNEQNFARLLDIKADLADLAHAEAAIDGFGEHSGRPRRASDRRAGLRRA